MGNDNINGKAVKAGAYYVISQFFVRGLSFFATPIIARLMSTEQYGVIRIYESWLLIAIPIVMLGLFRSVEVSKYDYKEKYESYVSNIVVVGIGLATCFACICFIFRNVLKKYFEFSGLMIVYMVMYVFAEFVIMCFHRREKQLMRYKTSASLTAVTMTMATVLSVILVVWAKNNGHEDELISFRIVGYYTPIILGGLVIAIMLIRNVNLGTVASDFRYGVVYSIPLIAEVLSIQIMNQSDKLMIKYLVDNTTAGIYSLATTVSYIIWVIEEAVWGAWQPWLYEKIDRKEIKDIDKPWTAMMHIFGILTVVISLLAPEIIAIMGGKKYKEAIYLVAPLLMSTLFRFYSYSFSAIQNYKKKTKYVAIGTVIAMLINVALNYIFIPMFGFIAAAYTTAMSYFLLMIIQAFLEKKVVNNKIIPLTKTMIISMLYFVISILTMQFYSVFFLRYVIFIIVFMLLTAIIIKKRTLVHKRNNRKEV